MTRKKAKATGRQQPPPPTSPKQAHIAATDLEELQRIAGDITVAQTELRAMASRMDALVARAVQAVGANPSTTGLCRLCGRLLEAARAQQGCPQCGPGPGAMPTQGPGPVPHPNHRGPR